MNVTLYKYFGNLKQLHKNLSSYIEGEDKKRLTNVYLKDGSSVTHPSLLITSIDDLSEFNYCYIPVWNRYYFMEVDSISNTLWEFKCSVDVLFSNVTAIDTNYAYIERSESLGNPLIVDDVDTFENVNDITITNLSALTQGDKYNLDLSLNFGRTDYNVSMAVVNDEGVNFYTNDGVNTYGIVAPTPSMHNITLPSDIGHGYYSAYYLTRGADINNSLKTIYQDTLASFIKSVIVWPMELPYIQKPKPDGGYENTPRLYTLRLGNSNFGSDNVAKPKGECYEYFTFFDYTFPSVSKYYDYEPYTTYELFIPFVGWRTINIKDIEGSRVLLSFRPNFESGKCTIYLINYTKDYVIASYDAQIGCLIPLSRSNLEEINAQETSNIIGMLIGMVGSAVSVGFGAVTGNPLAVGGGILGMTSSIAKGVQSNINLFEKGQVSIKDGDTGCNIRNVMLKKTSKVKVTSPSAQMGKPVKKVDLISNCSGFTQAKINKLSGLEYASKWEQDEIIRLFQEGIII